MPPTWTYECDEDLVHFLYDHIGKEDENLGSVKQYVDSIDVSSYTVSSMRGTGARLHQPCCTMGAGSMQGVLPCSKLVWSVFEDMGGMT